MLDVPSHVVAAQLAVPSIRYLWQDWREDRLYATTDQDDELLERLDAVSYRATRALTIACAEWVVYRYQGLAHIGMHRQYLEAAWAAVVDDRYLRTWRPDEDECSGPVHGPLAAALMMIQEGVDATAREGEGGLPVVYVANLAARVLPDTAAYRAWRDDAVARLQAFAPRDPRDTLGEVVPREFFDAAEGFRAHEADALMQRCMERLDPTLNPYLHTHEELLELHYDLPPYTYDAALDRAERW